MIGNVKINGNSGDSNLSVVAVVVERKSGERKGSGCDGGTEIEVGTWKMKLVIGSSFSCGIAGV